MGGTRDKVRYSCCCSNQNMKSCLIVIVDGHRGGLDVYCDAIELVLEVLAIETKKSLFLQNPATRRDAEALTESYR